MNPIPASYALHGCSPAAAYLRGCILSAQSAARIGHGAQWLRNECEARRMAAAIIAAGC